MENKRKNPPYMEICLCRRCASVYFNDPSYYIEAKQMFQDIKEPCDICQQYKGKDYRIWKYSTINNTKVENGGGGRN